jgi:hypothetical protein
MARYEVLKETSTKMTVFWDISACSLVVVTDVTEELTASIRINYY